MSFVQIWIHLVWATKNRECTINKTLKPKLLAHIRENAIEKEIRIHFINCVEDHVHALISLGNSQSISKIAKLIKGESSSWVNKNNLLKGKFGWQNEYFGVSISASMVDRVREYIKNQEEHHKRHNFMEEYEDFMQKYGFKGAG